MATFPAPESSGRFNKPHTIRDPISVEDIDANFDAIFAGLRDVGLRGVLPVPSGGTGLGSFTTGDLLVATSPLTIGGLNDVAVGNVLLSGGVGALPLYGKVALSGGVTHITGTLPIASGGTGQTTALAAFNALSPLTTKGDLLTRDATNNIRVAVGTNGQVLTANSAVAAGVEWANPASGSGDVVGPASSVDGEIVLFDGTTGKLIKAATGTGIVKVTDGVYEVGLVDLRTEVEGELPSAHGGFYDHDLLSAEHSDTIAGAPVYGDLIVAGLPAAFDIYRPLASSVVESFRGIRPAYLGGIPYGAIVAAPASGPFPQMLASRLSFVAVENPPGPYPYANAITSLLEDDFIGIRPAYIKPALGGDSVPASGPFPAMGNFPLDYVEPDDVEALTGTGQWQRLPIGALEGQVLARKDGLPQYVSDIALPGSVNATVGTFNLLNVGSAAIGLLDVVTVNASGLITASLGLVSNGDIAAADDISAGDQFLASNGSVGAPSYSFTSDTDSGLYHTVGSNEIALVTGGSIRLLINNGSFIVTDDILPNASGTFDLGEGGTRWRDLYLSDQIFERGRSVALGEWTSVAHAAGNFTPNTGTWTVDSGDQITFKYTRWGNTATIAVFLVTTSLTGTPGVLNIAMPITIVGTNLFVAYGNDNGPGVLLIGNAAGANIAISKADGTPFANATNNTALYFICTVEVS